MKSPNELDQFLRQKELEFEVPFDESYWEQARELIDRDRGHRRAAWWQNGNVRMAALALLMGSIAFWYAATMNSNQTDVATSTQNGVTEQTSPAPFMENESASAATGSGESSAAGITDNFFSTNSASTKPFDGHSEKTEITNNRLDQATTAATATASGNVTSNASSSTNSNSVSKQSYTSANKNTDVKSSGKNVSHQGVSAASRDMIFIAQHKAPNFFSYRLPSAQIPVFEEMTPDDPSLVKLYGLYYKSQSSSSRKIRDFKRGAQYPQISIGAAAGVNVFNQIKHTTDTNIYVGVNPFIGGKVCYQWNPSMMVMVMPTLAQRGGVRWMETGDSNSTIVPQHRHAYYLQLPAYFGLKVSKKNTLFAGGGASFLVGSGYELRNIETGKTEGSYKIGSGNAFNKIDYFASLAYHYRMNKRISFHAAFNYGFTDITVNNAANSDKHNNLQTSFGLTYQLYQNKVRLR